MLNDFMIKRYGFSQTTMFLSAEQLVNMHMSSLSTHGSTIDVLIVCEALTIKQIQITCKFYDGRTAVKFC